MSKFQNLLNGPLKSKLIQLIRLRGPLSVADYIKIVLTNPESGFYMNDDVFGVKGHFTTNPEISQIFGEVLGVWILQEWRRFSCPKPLRLVEFGPGRGTLLSDITRTLSSLGPTSNNNDDNIQLRLIEVSPKLKEIQQNTLNQQNFSKKILSNTKWISHLSNLDDDGDFGGFTAFIAHEYLDALPIHKFVRDPVTKGWRELVIDYDANEELRFCIARNPSLTTRLLVPPNFEGDHIEICTEAALQVEKVSSRLNSSKGKGCMLICDYGFEDAPEQPSPETTDDGADTRVKTTKIFKNDRDTFRAYKNHHPWPPLKDPGEADLTADVDFGYLKQHLRDKCTIFGPVDQKHFLVNCGYESRLQNLVQQVEGNYKDDLISGARMILEDMGHRYKFMSLFPKDSEYLFEGDPPAGFKCQ